MNHKRYLQSPILIALLQVLGVVAYVLIFAFCVTHLSSIMEPAFNEPLVAMTFFLVAFVTSALICGSLVLGYPLYLFLSNEKRKAVTIVLWSAFWFVAALLVILAIVLLLQPVPRYVILGI